MSWHSSRVRWLTKRDVGPSVLGHHLGDLVATDVGGRLIALHLGVHLCTNVVVVQLLLGLDGLPLGVHGALVTHALGTIEAHLEVSGPLLILHSLRDNIGVISLEAVGVSRGCIVAASVLAEFHVALPQLGLHINLLFW